MNVGCRIHKTISRPSRELVEMLRDIPVANLDDCMNRTAAICGDIRPMNSAKLLGTAFTVKVPEGDNLMFHKAMDMAAPGDVIMIDAGGETSRAIFGELMITYCQKRGIAGVVVDGSIRDFEEISKMNFPVYAKGITPNGPYKNGPGEIGCTISVGGIIVRPGDIVVGDADGVIVINPTEAEYLAKKAKDYNAMEENIRKGIAEGHYIRPWVDQKLLELHVEYID